jgi:DNA sulfur modification protein DndE
MTGIFLQGLPEMKLENVQLENIQMEADYGLVCSDAKNVKIKNLVLKTKKTPVIDLKNSTDVTIEEFISSPGVFPLIHVSGIRSGNTVFKNSGITNPDKQVVIGNEVPKNVIHLVK